MKLNLRLPGGRMAGLCGMLLVLLLAWIFFRHQIERPLAVHFILSSNAPREESFNELAVESGNPVDFLNRSWATGKIAHRELVAEFLKSCALTNPPWFSEAESRWWRRARPMPTCPSANWRSPRWKPRAIPRLFALAQAQLKRRRPVGAPAGVGLFAQTGPKTGGPCHCSSPG